MRLAAHGWPVQELSLEDIRHLVGYAPYRPPFRRPPPTKMMVMHRRLLAAQRKRLLRAQELQKLGLSEEEEEGEIVISDDEEKEEEEEEEEEKEEVEVSPLSKKRKEEPSATVTRTASVEKEDDDEEEKVEVIEASKTATPVAAKTKAREPPQRSPPLKASPDKVVSSSLPPSTSKNSPEKQRPTSTFSTSTTSSSSSTSFSPSKRPTFSPSKSEAYAAKFESAFAAINRANPNRPPITSLEDLVAAEGLVPPRLTLLRSKDALERFFDEVLSSVTPEALERIKAKRAAKEKRKKKAKMVDPAILNFYPECEEAPKVRDLSRSYIRKMTVPAGYAHSLEPVCWSLIAREEEEEVELGPEEEAEEGEQVTVDGKGREFVCRKVWYLWVHEDYEKMFEKGLLEVLETFKEADFTPRLLPDPKWDAYREEKKRQWIALNKAEKFRRKSRRLPTDEDEEDEDSDEFEGENDEEEEEDEGTDEGGGEEGYSEDSITSEEDVKMAEEKKLMLRPGTSAADSQLKVMNSQSPTFFKRESSPPPLSMSTFSVGSDHDSGRGSSSNNSSTNSSTSSTSSWSSTSASSPPYTMKTSCSQPSSSSSSSSAAQLSSTALKLAVSSKAARKELQSWWESSGGKNRGAGGGGTGSELLATAYARLGIA